MLIVLFIISLAIGTGGGILLYIYNRETIETNKGDIGKFMLLCSFASLFIIIIFTLIALCEKINLLPYKEKIAIIEEQNKNEIDSINEYIKLYSDYEKNSYKELSLSNIYVAYYAFPELKGNTMFETAIETIKKNNDEVKELRLELANERIYDWWLYFGGGKE